MSKEALSQAIDAAASRAEWDALLDAMTAEPHLKQQWSRAHQLRDAFAGVRVQASAEAFTLNVMAAIAAEPQEANQPSSKVVALAAPKPAKPVRLAVAEQPEKWPRRPEGTTRWKTWIPASAAAGALAAALLFGLNRPTASPVDASASLAAPVQLAQVNSAQTWAATPVSNGEASAAPDADASALLDSYLVEHSNTVAQQTVGGALHSARFAVQSAAFQPGE